MKKLLLTGLFLLCSVWLYAQTITGRVYGEGTNNIIAGATVYYGGSMAGTITNNDGWFELRAKQEQIPVIISCIGYYTSTATYKPGQPLIVYLKPKQEQLKTVTIRVNDMDRAEEIRIFKREFIGMSSYARSCTITNIDDVDFAYNKKTKTLIASCDKPLNIENKKLGYTITYYLDNFSRTPKNVHFSGNYIFKENKASTVQAQAEIKSNREDAYSFSRMQLIRALWSHTLRKSGFKIYTPYYNLLTEDSLIVRDSLKQQYVKLPPRVIVMTNNNTQRDNSYIIPTAKFVFIDKDGYYGPGFKWDGALIRQRIGDLLPFEYQSEKELKRQSAGKIATVREDSTLRETSKDKENTIIIPPNKVVIPDNRDWKQFTSIVLMPNNGSDSSLVVKKWQQPVRYKIYSRFNNKEYDKILKGYINQTLNKVAGIANCDITQTKADSLVNLYIIIGAPNEFADILPSDAAQYFNANSTNSCYYAATGNGFARMIACINPGNGFSLQDKAIGDPANKKAGVPAIVQNEDAKAAFKGVSAGKANKRVMVVANGSMTLVPDNMAVKKSFYGKEDNQQFQQLWFQARQILLKSFGFAGSTDNPKSLFDSSYNKWKPEDKINPADVRIIKALYSKEVKSGMHEQEVYATVKDMFTKNPK